MSEDDEGLTIDMGVSNTDEVEVGTIERATLQTLRRVSIPKDYVESSEFEIGDAVYLLYGDDSITVTSDMDKAIELREDLVNNE